MQTLFSVGLKKLERKFFGTLDLPVCPLFLFHLRKNWLAAMITPVSSAPRLKLGTTRDIGTLDFAVIVNPTSFSQDNSLSASVYNFQRTPAAITCYLVYLSKVGNISPQGNVIVIAEDPKINALVAIIHIMCHTDLDYPESVKLLQVEERTKTYLMKPILAKLVPCYARTIKNHFSRGPKDVLLHTMMCRNQLSV